MNDFQKIQNQLIDFAKERDWEQFHSAKNLIMAMTGEVGELSELFQWLKDSEVEELMKNKREAVEDEVADVMLYLLRLATILDIDVEKALTHKIKKNGVKYPAN